MRQPQVPRARLAPASTRGCSLRSCGARPSWRAVPKTEQGEDRYDAAECGAHRVRVQSKCPSMIPKTTKGIMPTKQEPGHHSGDQWLRRLHNPDSPVRRHHSVTGVLGYRSSAPDRREPWRPQPLSSTGSGSAPRQMRPASNTPRVPVGPRLRRVSDAGR
jgi:hypothetical protein